ncbi:MAG TPA: FKBP-type peptidyl-prolyl cis-trans isomerase [Candidatus Methylomirabilis sp.]
MKVQPGSLVSLDYDVLLESGEQIDSSAVNGPLRIRVGEWEALPGLGEKLVGLQPGDERLIRLSPSEGFGDWDPNVVLTVEKSRILGDVPVENGTTLRFETRDGASAACRLYHIEEGRVALDFNHPLAGEPLTVFVRIRRVVPPRRLKVGTAH